ncbi:response regulator [Gephyromycinifex aptenodytis]|uniref:response regulator n=1 Tax=Gephyromycinifex aptenodytis TaxID=2716227 RepID=UPI001446E4B2|nr:response regulator transcription factor [Gephyromycinifex aptenodytis]
MSETIRVAITDDQPLLVSAFSALIDAQPDMCVAAQAGNGYEAVEAVLAGEEAIDVILMDIRMPGLDGIKATERIVAAGGRPRVLVLTTFNLDELVLGALAAGARGFLLKDADPAVLLDSIRAVHRGEAVIDPQAAPAVLEALREPAGLQPAQQRQAAAPILAELTPRELEVLCLIARGHTNTEIGTELFIAETTVKTHVGNLLMKLHARDRVALVVLAHAAGLVSGDGPILLP